jgi:PAS domain S-box-containing protein
MNKAEYGGCLRAREVSLDFADGLPTTQPPVIAVDKDKCVNCHACISACPVKYCNDGSGDYVKVDADTCIGCGNCLKACLHQARRCVDDFDAFIADLADGVPIVGIVAPSAAASFPETYLNLIGWLKAKGLRAAFDVSFGAELTAYSLVEHIRTKNPRLVIASPCPAIVTFVQTYHPELLEHLPPVDSPMLHTVKMIRTYYPQFADCRIAAISPCAAKKRELAEGGCGDYNITYQSLARYLQENGIDLSREPAGTFENPSAERAVSFSTPGGLLETAQRWMPELAEQARRIEGSPGVYEYLRGLPGALQQDHAPLLVDCLSCEFGCNAGPAALTLARSPDEIEYWIRKRRQDVKSRGEDAAPADPADGARDITATIRQYWQNGLYTRQYTDQHGRNRIRIPDERSRWVILGQMHKYSEADLYNCTACGYLSCEGMATAIYNGKNKPENCHFYLAREREISHREMIEREKRFRNILTTCIEGFVSVDNDFVIQEVNPALCRMLGMGPDRLIGRCLRDLTDDSGKAEFDRQLELRKAGNSSVYEIRMIRGDGKTVDCIFSASPIRDGNNRRVGSFAMVTDITARKQAEEALRTARDDLEQRVQTRTAELARTNEDLHVEVAERKRAEATRHLNELRLEAMLRLYSMKERSVKEISDFALENAVAITESRIGYLAFLNEDESVLTMYSWSKSAMAECAIVDKPVEYPVHTTGLWGEAVRQRRPIITNDYAAPNPHKKGAPPGHVKIVRHMNVPVFDGDRIVLVAGVGNKAADYDDMDVRQLTLLMNGTWDIIRLKRSREALQAAKEAAEAATRAKSDFLAVMSHEIRTPMSGVIGMLDVLLKSPQPPDQQHHTRMARDSAELLLAILEDILDTSRIEAGKLSLEAIPFHPREVLLQTVESFQLRAQAKGLTLTCNVDGDVPQTLIGDPTRLRQVLNNLIGNAVKFTDQGGVIIHAACNERTAGEGLLEVSVRDSGVGIAPHALARLFEKFHQADTSTTRRYGGTGLGLSICKGLIDLMGGTIEVESEPGRGSLFRFRVRLPIASPEQSAITSRKDRPVGPEPRHDRCLRVLYAEDDQTNQAIIRILVERMGHQIDTVNDGQEAVAALSAKRYDAVLMDGRMPVMDGFAATRAIRDRSSFVLDHDVYIIALTANTSAADRERCLTAGMNDYLRKPVKGTELFDALARAIRHLTSRGATLPALSAPTAECPAAAPADPPPAHALPAPTAPPDPTPPIDLATAIHELGGRDVVDGLLARFLTDAETQLETLQTALEPLERKALEHIAHKLKGAAAAMKAAPLAHRSAQLEAAAATAELAELQQLARSVAEELQRLGSIAQNTPKSAQNAEPTQSGHP